MPTISILTACFNEAQNVEELYERVRAEVAKLKGYRYEHVFIDNCSTDGTAAILKRIAARDTNVKVILNARNFGAIRSSMHGLMQTSGDAVIGLVADFQDPPELIPTLVAKWEEGFPIVLCVKRSSEENALMFRVRKAYYAWVRRLSSIKTYENFTGFGLYDRKVIEAIRSFGDPYPYFRGMIAEIGYPHCEIPYDQPRRKRGFTKNNLYTLYDMAMLGVTSLSNVPLRFVTFLGFACSLFSLLIGLAYLAYKLLFWSNFSVGIAPLVIGLFFFGSIQLLALGILGEYLGAIHTQVRRRPFVIEAERVNFEHGPGRPALTQEEEAVNVRS